MMLPLSRPSLLGHWDSTPTRYKITRPTPVSDPESSSSQTGGPPPRPDSMGSTSCSSSRKQSRTSSHSHEPEEAKEECKNENRDEIKGEPKDESKDRSTNKTNKDSKNENGYANTCDDGGEKRYETPWWQGLLNTVLDLGAKIVVHVINDRESGNAHRNLTGPPPSSNIGHSRDDFTGNLGSAMDHDKYWGGDGSTQSRARTAKTWGFDHPGRAGDEAWNIALCNEPKRRSSSQ